MNSQLKKQQIVNVKANEIIKLFSSPVNRHSFAIENSKYNYIILDLYIPKLIGYDATFMLQVLSGDKKVIRFIIFFSVYH